MGATAFLILLRLAWSLFLSKGPRGGEMDDPAEEEEEEELDMYSWAGAARLALVLALALLLVRLPVVTTVRGV